MSSNALIDDFVLYTGCWKPYCRTKFHLGCSVGQEVINRHDIFMSSCWPHSRRQGGVATAHAHCGVCGWGVAGRVAGWTRGQLGRVGEVWPGVPPALPPGLAALSLDLPHPAGRQTGR